MPIFFQSCEIDGKHIEVLVISKAVNVPVTFEKTTYIRVGSYTKKIQEFQTIQSQLWEKLRREQFEDVLAVTDITSREIWLTGNRCGKYITAN